MVQFQLLDAAEVIERATKAHVAVIAVSVFVPNRAATTPSNAHSPAGGMHASLAQSGLATRWPCIGGGRYRAH